MAFGLLVACTAVPLNPRGDAVPAGPRVLLVTSGDPQLRQDLLMALNSGRGDGPAAEVEVLIAANRTEVTHRLTAMGEPVRRYDALFVDSITAARAAQLVLPDMPIVFEGVDDPVERCVVDTLQRPGRNATGYMHYLRADDFKMMQTLQLAFPATREVLMLIDHRNFGARSCDPADPYWTTPRDETCVSGVRALDDYLARRTMARELSAYAQTLQLKLSFVVMCRGEDLPDLIAWGAGRTAAGWLVPWHGGFDSRRAEIVQLVQASGLPAIYPHHGYTRLGGLMSLAAIMDRGQDRRSLHAVVQVVRGESPATLPVQSPRGFGLMINAAAARAQGLHPSLHVLRVADQVLQ